MSDTSSTPALITWGGMDVSSDTFDISFCASNAEPPTPASLRRRRVTQHPRTREGVRRLLDQLPAGRVRLVMESTGRYSFELACWIRELAPAVELSIVNPRRILDYGRSLGLRNKTDRIDARVIASYAAERRPGPWTPPSTAFQSVQVLSRTRQALVESRTRHANQLTDLMRGALPQKVRGELLEGIQAVLDTLDEQVRALEKAMDELLEREPALRADVELADSIPGVGRIVAGGLLGELGDMRRFGSRRLAEFFTGMNVGLRKSGKSVNVTRGLTKEGSDRVRRLLYLAAMSAVRGRNAFAEYYRRLRDRGKQKKVALGAVMRKMLNVIRQVIISGREYDDAKVCAQMKKSNTACA